ncbi:class I SAM-dependent methyltransferase [Brevibacillus humidisoli]|uniref:SAM-dependent methyltransferase n=1 Tax=Brevibacillus humidisoli TaxID=2895522 RepID=UPI001E3DEF03|nr:class I SAM-dependent methyltransferase [Brevibacillus humidisoli]UFJ43131.1 class I SAM-dependent methyltransferase [Brevibacillus humidisoli]
MDDHDSYKQILLDSFTNSYQTGKDLWSLDQGLTDIAQLLLSRLSPDSPQHVLDIGTGNGRHAELFLAQGIRFTGIDLYRHRDWEKYERLYSDSATFVHSPFLDWNNPAAFTAILDNGCFHHQHPAEYGPYLKKIYQLLTDGGYLTLGLYAANDHETIGRFEVMPSGKYRRYFTPVEIQSLLQENGFVCLQVNKVLVKERNRYYLAALAQKPGKRGGGSV